MANETIRMMRKLSNWKLRVSKLQKRKGCKDGVEEPSDNIEVICSKCLREKYPYKGTFTAEALRGATHVKAAFGAEHMWVKVRAVTSEYVVGTVDNIPILSDSPRYGEEVEVPIGEVEDALFEGGRDKTDG